MTRTQLVTAAATRLGDTSAAFLTVLDGFFDDVLRDLAQAEAITDLRQEASFDIIVDQENYSTQVICGLAANSYPTKILRLHVPSWAWAGAIPAFREADSDYEYESRRAALPDMKGTAELWRTYPNRRQVQLWPPADATNAGVGLGRVLFLAHPLIIAGGAELLQIDEADLETIVWGIVMRGAPFRDETLESVDSAAQYYERGKGLMWGKLHNAHPKRVVAQDF